MAKTDKPVATAAPAIVIKPDAVKTEAPTTAVAKADDNTAKANAALAVFGETEGKDSAARQQGFGFAYVGFFGEKAKPETRAPLEAAGVKVGEFYLHDVEPIRLVPFTFHLLKFTRLYTKQNQKMEITDCKLESNDDDFKAGYREHLFCVVAVRLPSPEGISFVPAVLALRSGQAKALSSAIKLAGIAKNVDGWKARSDKHAKSAIACVPGGRYVVAISSTVEEMDDGNTFNEGHGLTSVTEEAQAQAFNSWFHANAARILYTNKINDERIADAKSKLRS